MLTLTVLAISGLAVALAPPPYRWVGIGQLVMTAAAAARQPHAAERWAVAHTTVVIALAILIACRLPMMLIACLVLAWLAIFRAWTASQDSGLQVILLLAFMQATLCTPLLAAAVSPWIFAALILLGPVALASIQQRSPPIMLLALGLGVVSLGTGWLVPETEQKAQAQVQGVGFSREISLGELGPLHDDLTLLARLRTAASLPEEVYLRGVILDRFTGSSWISSAPPEPAPASVVWDGALQQHQLVLAPLTEGVLLGVPSVVEMEGGEGVSAWRDQFGTWRYTGPVPTVSYTTWSAKRVATEPLQRPGRWLGLPAEMDPRVRSLAAQLAAEGPSDRLGQVRHVEGWLRDNYTYTRLPADDTARQALSTFLFDSRAGHCEYFATALAVLLRAQGIAARVVTGVRGLEQSEDGERLFRQRDAHAWVEVYLDGQGWVGVDATPPELRRPAQQMVGEAATGDAPIPRGLFCVTVGLAALAALGGGLELARRQRQEPLLLRYRRARRLVARRGWDIPPSLPPAAAGDWLVAHAGGQGQPLVEIAELLYQSRYGGLKPAARITTADEALQRLRKLSHRS